jgi:hypothetical protein
MEEIEFKLYLGCKVIKASPMTRSQVEALIKRTIGGDQDGDGYLVEYPDGYQSWSPKDVFETAYRELTTDEAELIESFV